jgi:hypothetical protein
MEAMMTGQIDFESDIEQISGDDLSLVSKLTRKARELQAEIAQRSEELSALNAQLKVVVEDQLPEAMNELGMVKISLADGSQVSIETTYHASIPGKLQEQAFEWLRKNGFADLIKHQLQMNFTRSEDERAAALADYLMDQGYEFSDKTLVHPQTLKAFVKEQSESGRPVPPDLFGVYVRNVAKIK